MLSKKINKKDIMIIILAISFAIFGAVICATLSGPAIAIDEETKVPEVVEPTQPVTPEPAPAPTSDPAPELVSPEPEATPTDDPQQESIVETVVEKIFTNEEEINKSPIITYKITPDASFAQYCNITKNESSPEDTFYKANVKPGRINIRGDYTGSDLLDIAIDKTKLEGTGYTFDGFYVDGTLLASATELREDTEIEVVFRTNKVEVCALYSSQFGPQFVSDYIVSAYDKNHNFVESKVTNFTGRCSFFNLDVNGFEYSFYALKDGWTVGLGMVSLEDLNEEKYASLSLGGVAPIENKKISLNSSSDNHEYFKIHLHESDSSSTYLDETYYVSSWDYWFSQPNSVTYAVLADNSIQRTGITSDYVEEGTFTAIGKSGCRFDYWMCDYDGTGPKRLNPGDSFSVTSSSENVNLEAFYTEAPGPGPEPGPTPTPTPDPGSNTGSLTSSPTTGDTTNTGLVSLALLAVIAGIIYIVYRKRILNY